MLKAVLVTTSSLILVLCVSGVGDILFEHLEGDLCCNFSGSFKWVPVYTQKSLDGLHIKTNQILFV